MATVTGQEQHNEAAVRVLRAEMNRLRGRLCTLVESFGLPHGQERACVSMIKLVSYDAQRHVEQALRGHGADLDDGTES